MRSLKILLLGFMLILAACSPAAPASSPTAAATSPAAQPAQIESPAPPTPSPSSEAGTATPAPASDTPESPTTSPPTAPAPATLSEWEQVQAQVESYRNRLERASDGYNGLSEALEQPEPNQIWCNGLSAAIGDFNYINDAESAQALEDLKSAQGCP